jgi:PKD domain
MSLRLAKYLPWGLVVLFAGAACRDAVAPRSRALPPPSFSYSPNGTSLNQVNGSLRENGTVLIKGFNPTNPHHGDAIIATFYWLGSTNIVDSVDDVLTNPQFTPVGNKYTLVEYVTAGGYSMATYVATNVQNFPDPNTDPGQSDILAVRAHLSQAVTDGGITISSWTGVDDNFATALGDHRSAAGSDTTTVSAHAGAISADAGAIVYSVTMGGLTGLDRPAGFTDVLQGSDDSFKQDAAYVVPANSGSLDPQWTWFYSPPAKPWLVTTLALRRAPPPTGDLTATTTTTGADLDPDGYTVTVDGTQSSAIGVNGSTAFPGLSAGGHSVQLSGLAANCAVSGANPQSVNVPAGGAVTAAFSVNCTPITGNIAVTTTSGGANIPTSYTVTVDGGNGQTIASNNGSVTYTALLAGNHTVVLTVPANCTVSGGPSRTATVIAGQTITVPYSVNCNAPPVVNAGPNETALTGVLYSLHWSFTDANHNGPWTYRITWGDGSTSTGTVTSEGSYTTGHTYVTVLPKAFTVTVTVTDAAGAPGSRTKTVSVLLL